MVKFNIFAPVTLSARELAEGFVRYCEFHQNKLELGVPDEEIEDIEFMLCLSHIALVGPFDLCVNACEIIASEFPDSKAYEQLLLGFFGDLIEGMSQAEKHSCEGILNKITASEPLSILANEMLTRYLSDDAKALATKIQKDIGNRSQL